MDPLGAGLTLGVTAGLALALPVGPVSLLVVQEGLVRGFRIAAGAAVGVASVDAAYATIAATAGGGAARLLEANATTVRVVSALALVAVAAHGLRQTLAGRGLAQRPAAGDVEIAAAARARETPVRAYVRFVALTAVNPLTAIAFASVAVALAPRLAGAGRAAFVVGVVCASAGWQLTLAVAGSTLGARLGARARTWFSVIGHAAVVVLAVVVAFG